MWDKIKEKLNSIAQLSDLSKLSSIVSDIWKLAKSNPKNAPIKPDLNFIGTSEDELEMVRYIAQLALRVEEHWPDGEINALVRHSPGYVTYSYDQIAWVIALGFFCCILTPPKSTELPFPINFINWISGTGEIFKQKMLFMKAYFNAVKKEEEKNDAKRVVSFERLSMNHEEYKCISIS